MDETAKTVLTGEIAGSVTAVQLPNVPCAKVKLKAVAGNAGNVYIGGSSSVAVPDGSSDEVTGFGLDAGEDTDWIWIGNLNELYIICDNPGDDLVYIALK